MLPQITKTRGATYHSYLALFALAALTVMTYPANFLDEDVKPTSGANPLVVDRQSID